LARRDGNGLSGNLFAARLWASANRPDLARQEVKAALDANPKYVSGLLLAGQLAQADEDWDELQRLAGLMAEVIPNSLEGYVWKAIALENQGKAEDAKKIYEQLMKESPNLSTGYLRLAAILEDAKDYAGALELLRKWSKLSPQDPNGFRGQVRVLAKS